MQPKTAKRRSAFRRANRTMPRRRIDIAIEAIDYKNPDLLKKFVTESGKILPRRVTGMPAHLHRKITREIKRSRSVLVDEIIVARLRRYCSNRPVAGFNEPGVSEESPASRLPRPLALLDQFPKLARLAKLRILRDRQFAPEKKIAHRVLMQNAMDRDSFDRLFEVNPVTFRPIPI